MGENLRSFYFPWSSSLLVWWSMSPSVCGPLAGWRFQSPWPNWCQVPFHPSAWQMLNLIPADRRSSCRTVPKSPGEFQPKSTRLLGSHQPWFPGPLWDLHLLATSLHPDSTWEGLNYLNSVGFLMVFETEKSGMDWVFDVEMPSEIVEVCRSKNSCSGCFRWRVHDRWWWGMSLKG